MNIIQKTIDRYYTHHKHIWVLVLLGALTGLIIGLIATSFQFCIDGLIYFKNYLFHVTGNNIYISIAISIIFTVSTVSLSILIVRRFANEAGGSGIHEVEGALKGCRRLRVRVIPTKFVSGFLALASGLSLGKEGPTVHMSATVAQIFVNKFNLKRKYANALVSSGAGAGLAAAFNTPLSGIIFVIEEMNRKFRFSVTAIKCVIITSIVSIVVSRMIVGNPPAIRVETFSAVPQNTLWLFLVLGAIFGYLGLLFCRGVIKVSDYFNKGSQRRFWFLVIAVSTIFGVGVVAMPNSVGGGYIVIANAFQDNLGLQALLVVFILRFVGVLFSYATGVAGGIFAPMIALGTVFGLLFGAVVNILFPQYNISAAVFAVAGMSGLFTATVGAPLTGIVLVMEMTWNYQLLLPLMITCFSASMVTYIHHQKPIYDVLLRRAIYKSKQAQGKLNNKG